MLKKHKGEASSKDAKVMAVNDGSRKRAAEKAPDGRAPAKRPLSNLQSSSRQEGTKSRGVDRDFQTLTVERLRALLKEKGLSLRGKKASSFCYAKCLEVFDELIARLRGVNGSRLFWKEVGEAKFVTSSYN
ncbi:hypothetical protein RJ639_026964 [Escallonia herrerae]|uniref:SAP domain-containing protein n=1 Tax=Escallonia herrerae TaxID=1293975 RepID=A0AA88XC00_9ASTE|nr:hypothetical protein RJ639_026964 [Escallonia herrerae]